MKYNKITRGRFDAEAESYDQRMHGELKRNAPIYALVVQELKRYSLQSSRQKLVVNDICCGTGFAWSKIKSNVPELNIYTQGLDFSPSMVSLASEKEIYDECICHDVTESWAFSRLSDLTICIRDSLSNMSEGYEQAVTNIVANMKPESKLIIDANFISSVSSTQLHPTIQNLYRKFCTQFPNLQYEELVSSFPNFMYYAIEDNVFPSRLKLYRMNELITLLSENGILVNEVYGINYSERGRLFPFPRWNEGIDTITSSHDTEKTSKDIETIVIVGSKLSEDLN